MDIAITIPDTLATIAQQQATVSRRTLSQQIVYWTNFGKLSKVTVCVSSRSIISS